MLVGHLDTVFGWRLRAGRDPNPRRFRNYPMQGNGAEMLRLACAFTTEDGVAVCAPVHDALLIEALATDIDHAVTVARAAMDRASATVLGGFVLRTDAEIVRWPGRLLDDADRSFFDKITALLPGHTGVEAG
jgi:hypothetical protein